MKYLCITIVMKKIYDDFEAAHWTYKYVMSDKSVGWGGSVVVQILTFGNSAELRHSAVNTTSQNIIYLYVEYISNKHIMKGNIATSSCILPVSLSAMIIIKRVMGLFVKIKKQHKCTSIFDSSSK